jgi:hypothetical protein
MVTMARTDDTRAAAAHPSLVPPETARQLDLAGLHGAVRVTVDLMSQHTLEVYYHIKADYPGQVRVNIAYRGHRDDVVAAGCISAEALASIHYGWPYRDADRLLYVDSKAGPGRRGWIEVSYSAARREFAAVLPGVRELFPEGLPRSGPTGRDELVAWQLRRPRLRLVIDNGRMPEPKET